MKLILIIGIILLFIPISICETIDLEYTDNFKTYSFNLTENSIINLPTGNVIDSMEFKPKFLPVNHEIMYINVSYNLNDIPYMNSYRLETDGALLKLYSTKFYYQITHYANDDLNHQKNYEAFLYSYCWFTTKIHEYYGSQPDITDEQILIHSEITTSSGINRKNDVFNVYNAKSYVASNYSIELNNLDDIDCIITYKIEGLQTTDYYIGLLNPTLKICYEIGFSWIDKDLYILNLFIICTYIINFLGFWLNVLAVCFIPLMFVILFFVIPFVSYFNAYSQKSFIENLVRYYSLLISVVLSFVNFIIQLSIKFIELARSLIPFL